jgi:general secretion pathway protein J
MNRPSQRGFTLVELLVGLTLLGFIMVAVTGGMRIGLIGADRVTERAADGDVLRGVQSFLRERLQAARPVRWTTAEGRNVVAFEGRHDRLGFVTDMPSYPDIGGLYKLTLSRRDNTLVLARTLTDGRAPGFADDEAMIDVIANDIGALRFAYFGRPNGRGVLDWHDAWPDANRLPELIRIDIAPTGLDRPDWPAIIVAPRLGEQPR